MDWDGQVVKGRGLFQLGKLHAVLYKSDLQSSYRASYNTLGMSSYVPANQPAHSGGTRSAVTPLHV